MVSELVSAFEYKGYDDAPEMAPHSPTMVSKPASSFGEHHHGMSIRGTFFLFRLPTLPRFTDGHVALFQDNGPSNVIESFFRRCSRHFVFSREEADQAQKAQACWI